MRKFLLILTFFSALISAWHFSWAAADCDDVIAPPTNEQKYFQEFNSLKQVGSKATESEQVEAVLALKRILLGTLSEDLQRMAFRTAYTIASQGKNEQAMTESFLRVCNAAYLRVGSNGFALTEKEIDFRVDRFLAPHSWDDHLSRWVTREQANAHLVRKIIKKASREQLLEMLYGGRLGPTKEGMGLTPESVLTHVIGEALGIDAPHELQIIWDAVFKITELDRKIRMLQSVSEQDISVFNEILNVPLYGKFELEVLHMLQFASTYDEYPAGVRSAAFQTLVALTTRNRFPKDAQVRENVREMIVKLQKFNGHSDATGRD